MAYVTSMERFGIKIATERAMEKGIQQGMQQGERLGEISVLLRLIELKFGQCPDWVKTKLHEADKAALAHWTAVILTATSLESLFAS